MSDAVNVFLVKAKPQRDSELLDKKNGLNCTGYWLIKNAEMDRKFVPHHFVCIMYYLFKV